MKFKTFSSTCLSSAHVLRISAPVLRITRVLRISRLVLLISALVLFISAQIPAFSQDDYDKTLNQAKASYTNYSDCIKLYKLPTEKLFALALSSISAHRYEILEMQSRNGYIIFQTGGKEFLASVMKRDKNYSYLKIAPADNNYYFSSEIPKKIFNYVDLNFNAELKELKF